MPAPSRALSESGRRPPTNCSAAPSRSPPGTTASARAAPGGRAATAAVAVAVARAAARRAAKNSIVAIEAAAVDASREHELAPGKEGVRVLEQHDPDVQTSTSASSFDTTGSGVAPKTGDYSSGAGAGFTGGAAGAVGARTGEAPPPGQEPAGGLVGGGYDSARAAATAEGAVNPGGRPTA
ncbi:hypothetical protein Rsub_04694 [Raphidocelis subcapitata]|uniref:Uncharacterized protein n=1 Tax=Raphidocelis subcapitata TaxID=307507 RepID=A0A2V0P299_9CHLO|nr:hypothetical protein Rsub_04694 [Raphidocelis subcapitata]|eukprot:GBF91970.1 hypothetical protein Rsub_04694 [Raphidocelis subcapitata]